MLVKSLTRKGEGIDWCDIKVKKKIDFFVKEKYKVLFGNVRKSILTIFIFIFRRNEKNLCQTKPAPLVNQFVFENVA